MLLNSSTLSRAYPGEIRIVRASLPGLSFVFSDVGFASFWGSLQFWVCRRSAAHFTDHFLLISKDLSPFGAPLKCGRAGGAPHNVPMIFFLGIPSFWAFSNVGVQEEGRSSGRCLATSIDRRNSGSFDRVDRWRCCSKSRTGSGRPKGDCNEKP